MQLEERIRRFGDFDLDGGHPVLDFANTVDWRGTERAHDWLAEPADFLAWGHRAGLLTKEQAQELAAYAAANPERASRIHVAALRFREALFGLLKAIIEDGEPQPADLELVNAHLRRVLAHTALSRRAEPESAYRLSSSGRENAFEQFLFEIIRRAADLLTTIDPRRLKICGAQDCGWVFLDTTKNSSRRWCDMASCGNRAKAQRFYHRKKKAAPERVMRRSRRRPEPA